MIFPRPVHGENVGEGRMRAATNRIWIFRMPTDFNPALLAAKSQLAAIDVIRALQILIDLTARKEFDPDEPRDDDGQWTDGPGSDGSHDENSIIPIARRPGPQSRLTEDQVRSNIASIADNQVGRLDWQDSASRSNFPAPSNKCNLFVYEVLSSADADPGLPNGWINNYPPTAGQWADPAYAIPNWRVLPSEEPPLPGDVVAQHIEYDDASGHVMIVGRNGNFIGTGEGADAHGQIVDILARDNLGRPGDRHGPLVYRRWSRSLN